MSTMDQTAQNFAVAFVLLFCAIYVGWQVVQALRGRKSRLGSCCAKGCGTSIEKSHEAPQPPAVQFMPLENLGRGMKK